MPASPLLRRVRAGLLALAALIVLAAGPTLAACAGEDMVPQLPAEERAELEAAAAAVSNGTARLWRVEAPTGAVGYLFGTYHDTEAIETLTPAVEAAFAEAERLAVELTHEEMSALEARLAADPSFSLQTGPGGLAARLAEGLSPAERAAAEEVLAARGITLGMATQLKPWLLFSLLGTPACQLQAMGTGAAVLDTVLIERAEARGLPVSGLEDYETALGAFSTIDDASALRLARDMLALAPQEEDIRRTLLTAYAAGQTGMIQAFADQVSRALPGRSSTESDRTAEAFSEAVLDARNDAWMERLLPLMGKPG
ncbi:MAG: TraB/GumN family protein, partial [Pseudomonadota bacterium]